MSSHVDNVLIDEIVPRLRHLIPHHVPRVGSEDPEELLQDATLIAVRLLARARVNGKTVTPGNIAYYTLLHLRSGRAQPQCESQRRHGQSHAARGPQPLRLLG